MKFLYLPIFYLISSFLTTSLIILINLSTNLVWLTSQGFDISIKMFFELLLRDISNGFLFLVIILITFFLGFLITAIVRYFFSIKRSLSYSISGLASIFVMLNLTTLVFDGAILIAGMRYFLGFLLFCISGLLGGYLYGLMLNKVFKNEN
tara:strand:- start:163 stop:612 length:450 start_codon:yes stop_codon:yes gene_type:complete